MVDIQVGHSQYQRRVAKEPIIALRNRFFEQNPVLNLTQDFPALIARPALKKIAEVGTGHIRFVFSETGTFDDNAFIVSGLDLYRMDNTATATLIGTISNDTLGAVSMAATGNIGETPAHLFIADGGVLWVYTEDGSAIGHLQASGAIANNDTVSVGGVYYKWTNAGVDVGTPDGTVGNPWLVELGTTATSLNNLYYAINAGGGAGTIYSTALTANQFVASNVQSGDDLYVVAREAGTDGNAIAVTETGANLSWITGATLIDGGTDQLRQVGMPDDVGAISVATYNSYVVVVPVQDRDVNGRFYWIDPGETFVDPLNFATAERSPDAINQVLTLSDRIWLFGQSSTEAWVTTGDIDAPFIRMQGILYEDGAWAGSGVRIGNQTIVVNQYGGVVLIAGGIKIISRPDIAEMIREAIGYQQTFGG